MSSTHQQDIDRVLNGLRQTEPPAGLEARIGRNLEARVASASSARNTFFAAILTLSRSKGKGLRIFRVPAIRYALATTALLIVSLTLFHRHHTPQQIADIPTTNSVILSEVSRGTIRETHPKDPGAPLHAKTARTFSATNPPLCDCDPTALAETLAPSHPAPTMLLTPQEQLLLRAIHPGSPIEVAELDQLREPAFRAAAAAREHANLRQYIQGILSPLAIAQTLDSTSPSQPAADDTQPLPAPEPPASK